MKHDELKKEIDFIQKIVWRKDLSMWCEVLDIEDNKMKTVSAIFTMGWYLKEYPIPKRGYEVYVEFARYPGNVSESWIRGNCKIIGHPTMFEDLAVWIKSGDWRIEMPIGGIIHLYNNLEDMVRKYKEPIPWKLWKDIYVQSEATIHKIFEFINQFKKTSAQWREDYALEWEKILDPDWWDRKNYDFSFNQEKITYQEFMDRLSKSTCIINRSKH